MRQRSVAVFVALLAQTWPGAPTSAQAPSLPRVTPVFESTTIDASPISIVSVIRVDQQGRTFFESERGSTARLTVLDSTGAIVARFAKFGRGPGEVVAPLPVNIGPDGFITWDMAQLRFAGWSNRGDQTYLGPPIPALVPAVHTARGVLAVQLVAGAGVPVLTTADFRSVRQLLDTIHPFLKKSPVPGAMGAAYLPSLGTWTGGFVVGRPGDYALGFFGWDGKLVYEMKRPVPQVGLSAWRVEAAVSALRRRPFPGVDTSASGLARIRSTMMQTRLPGFSQGSSIGLDGAGRVLVAGIEGDSAFVDFFSPPHYLGRVGIPCLGFQGRWSVQGSWLAFVCQSRDPSFEGDATIKLFRLGR
jgi:hypothetical protein